MKIIKLLPKTGIFAENKDIARDIRIKYITPVLEKNEEITLDFEGVESATQSFVHALISELIRNFGNEVLDNIYFKKCNKSVQEIINIVVDYMQAAT
ncbi:STAS-like domain-containing protein [Candidatus Roizmanbacteria bacterium]|nr:STAS-like domain-containing protein [Candidatus Roizmanbacteria bacterium]